MNESPSQVALVTGASRGIGRAIALQLAKDGYNISFCYRQASVAAKEAAHEIHKLNRRVFQQPCDVSDFAAVENFVRATEKELGPMAVVVNSAGIIKDNPLVLMDQAAWRAVIDTNLNGIYNVCRNTVFGFMKRKTGCIINISSVAGVYGNPTQTNYSAAKAGIIGFSKALAKEVGPHGIRVNVVAPGAINTDMIKETDPKVVERMISCIPLRRIGQAQEVADLVSFLASYRASYITGQTIQIDGGMVL